MPSMTSVQLVVFRGGRSERSRTIGFTSNAVSDVTSEFQCVNNVGVTAPCKYWKGSSSVIYGIWNAYMGAVLSVQYLL
jgi:hypothetical protein